MVQGIGRKIAKHHRARQTPHGKQSVKKLMAHGASASSIELSGDTKLFDRVARKWNVDYAFYKTGPDKYLLFFKSGQADAMTACFSECGLPGGAAADARGCGSQGQYRPSAGTDRPAQK